jgi:hypothetical protein
MSMWGGLVDLDLTGGSKNTETAMEEDAENGS